MPKDNVEVRRRSQRAHGGREGAATVGQPLAQSVQKAEAAARGRADEPRDRIAAAEGDDERLRVVGDEVLLRALRLLKANAYAPVREVRCRYSREGRLTLSGTVPCYYLKQVAQAALRPLLETGIQIQNELHVEWQ